MTNPLNELSTNQQRELYEICWRFEQALSEGQQVTVAEFIPTNCSLDRELLVAELTEIQSDWEELSGRSPSNWSPMSDDRYELREEIARGGSAVVWRVWDKHLQRETAVKCLLDSQDNEAMRARLEREARLCARLVHPGIVPIHELSKFADGKPFVSMKLVEGKTLLQLLAASPPITLSTATEIITKVCQAMAFAHAKGIIHRDLKPSNIMVGAFGEVQIMDWGLGKDLRQADSAEFYFPLQTPSSTNSKLPDELDRETPRDEIANDSTRIDSTLNGSVIGTLAYMAPEQARGAMDRVDRRSDVFALGAILCRILIGISPYQGADENELLRQARNCDLTGVIPRLQSCRNRRMADLAIRCMSPDQDARPADAQQVLDLLGSIRQADRRRTWALAMLGVFALVCCGALFSRWIGDSRRVEPQAEVKTQEPTAPEKPPEQPAPELDLTDPSTIESLFFAKQFKLLLASYPLALAKHPADYFLHRNICSSLLTVGRYVEAEAVSRKLIELADDQAEPYFLHAESLLLQGKNQQALEEYKRSKSCLVNGQTSSLPIDFHLNRAQHRVDIEAKIASGSVPDTDSMTYEEIVEIAKVCESSHIGVSLDLYVRALTKASSPQDRSFKQYHIMMGYQQILLREDLQANDRNLIAGALMNWMREQFHFATSDPATERSVKAELLHLLKHGAAFSHIRSLCDDKRVDEKLRKELAELLREIDPPK